MSRTRLILVGAIVVVLAAAGVGSGYVYIQSRQPYRQLPAVHVSAELAQSAQTKFDTISNAATEAAKLGKPVEVKVTFTDDELTSYARQKLNSNPNFELVVLHANSAGTIEGTANALYQGQKFPIYVDCKVTVEGSQPTLTVIDSRMGTIDMPSQLLDQVNSEISKTVNLGGQVSLQNLQVVVSEGLVTISGTAKPAA